MKKIIQALDVVTEQLGAVICYYFPEDTPPIPLDRRVKSLIDSSQQLALHVWEALKDYEKAYPALAEQVDRTLRV